jgi:hypothetical protein
MSQSHFHEAPGERSHQTAATEVSRNTHGQSLEDAREAFRVEWQAQIQEKERAAGRSRELAVWYGKAREILYAGGRVLGGVLGLSLVVRFGWMTAGPLDLVQSMVFGAIGGMLAATPLAMVTRLCEWFWQQRAEKREREARELERS